MELSVSNDRIFRHNFDCLTPICSCGTGIENNKHFFLHCPKFDSMHAVPFGQLSEITAPYINDMNTTAFLCSIPLFSSSELKLVTKRMILEATISYIKTTHRFQRM